LFQVFQNGKPADCFGYPEMDKSWNNSTFQTKREAEIYAFHWAYPYSNEECEKNAPEMEIGKEYEYSMIGVCPGEKGYENYLVLMRIEKLD